MQGRLSMLEVLLVESAVLATATSALGLVDLHRVFKPLTLFLAIVLIAGGAHTIRAGGRFSLYFLGALSASLAGDVLLMFPGYFIPGLLAFLLAHLFYIALFSQGVAWFPDRQEFRLNSRFNQHP